MKTVTDVETLERLYGVPGKSSVLKEVDHLHPAYRPFIERSPFMVLATSGPEGLDVSPRGDPAGFVVIEDAHTLLLPDRRGNNRMDSLRNILADPRVALLFFVPGVNETLRVNGRASIVIEPSMLERFPHDGKLPRSVLRITVETVFFQCSRALIRSGLWDPARQVPRAEFPSPGSILEALSPSDFDGGEYDRELPARVKTTLY
ncbi:MULTISPECIES: pyridoxamine 5'-phosphate oxidase family protein [unclassified Corallococcus]|uniref:pyridoxamine 5'-phosphate oxidase family protein n=1 Tax=unclassified Corallococcus TaxID=2685029 RepID=UPI001A8E53D1|nr:MULTISPECIES: pyridoxamine 5'-phosphate oxidase family protein [unclassified Corallococcus]MBN9684909.1 pyridoxamine 5'-phosphate oxidase family protein [Corallococcus sp. NCSPR001]WAS83628.1 pyridoxamine 5'-phosphate oxidase family protein [Corallococcus sp. NCRR]